MNESARFDILGALPARNAKVAGIGPQENAASASAGEAEDGADPFDFSDVFAAREKLPPRISESSQRRGEFVKTPPIAEAGEDAKSVVGRDPSIEVDEFSTIKTAPNEPVATDLNISSASSAAPHHFGKRGDRPLFLEVDESSTIKPAPNEPAVTDLNNSSASSAAPHHFGKRGDRPLFLEEHIAVPHGYSNDVLPEIRIVDGFDEGRNVLASGGAFAIVEEEGRTSPAAELRYRPTGSLPTIRLQDAPLTNAITIKPHTETGGHFPTSVVSTGPGHPAVAQAAAESNSAAITGTISTIGTGGLTDINLEQVKKAIAELDLPLDRPLEFRASSFGSTSAFQASPPLHMVSAPVGFSAVSVAPLLSVPGEGIALSDEGLPFDPSLSIQAAAQRSAGGGAFAVAPNASSYANMTGVLPQIQAAISARNGSEVVELRLDPPELGRIRIDFDVDGAETLKAVIGAERPETLDHLKRNIADLEQQLKQAGFGSVSFEFRAGGGGDFSQDRTTLPFSASENSAEATHTAGNTVYLSLRENAQLDLLV